MGSGRVSIRASEPLRMARIMARVCLIDMREPSP
jgi:hypothetical protein